MTISPIILKIYRCAEWEENGKRSFLKGSPDDERDGFIHFSTPAQLHETAHKHFCDVDEVILLEVDADKLGKALKWEPSRGGKLFPHLYGDLDASAILRRTHCRRDRNGRFMFPDLIEKQ